MATTRAAVACAAIGIGALVLAGISTLTPFAPIAAPTLATVAAGVTGASASVGAFAATELL